MFNWLSNYDYDFALSTIPIQIILLLFYGSRRNLPIRQSTSFSIVMISNLIMTVTDIVACEMIADFKNHSLFALYFINMVYFLSFVVRGWALFDYTSECCRKYKILDSHSRFLAALPLIVVSTLILITPWAKTIFTFTDKGYQNCALYRSIYICTYFYIFGSYINIFFSYKDLSTRQRWGLLSYNTILFTSSLSRSSMRIVFCRSFDAGTQVPSSGIIMLSIRFRSSANIKSFNNSVCPELVLTDAE